MDSTPVALVLTSAGCSNRAVITLSICDHHIMVARSATLTNVCSLSQQMSATSPVSLLQETAGCVGRVWHLSLGMRGAFRIRCNGHLGLGLQQHTV